MHARTRLLIAAAGIAAVAMFAVAGTVTAASAAPADPAASAEAQATVRVVVDAWSAEIPDTRTVHIPRSTCPDVAPYLVNQPYSPGRIVIPGVEVIESGGVGVTIPDAYAPGPSHHALGMDSFGASATNWNPFGAGIVRVRLHCTSDPAESYTR